MVTEKDLLNDKWISAAGGYIKLGVTLIKCYNEWECYYAIGTNNARTISRKYDTLEELYSDIKQTVEVILSSKYHFLQNLTVKQKRTLKNWIL